MSTDYDPNYDDDDWDDDDLPTSIDDAGDFFIGDGIPEDEIIEALHAEQIAAWKIDDAGCRWYRRIDAEDTRPGEIHGVPPAANSASAPHHGRILGIPPSARDNSTEAGFIQRGIRRVKKYFGRQPAKKPIIKTEYIPESAIEPDILAEARDHKGEDFQAWQADDGRLFEKWRTDPTTGVVWYKVERKIS